MLLQTLPAWLETSGTVLGSALVASLVFWVAKRRGTDEPIKPEKTAVTIGVAFVLSVALLVTGRATNQDQLLAQLAPLVGPASVWVQEGIQRYQETDPSPEPKPGPEPEPKATDDAFEYHADTPARVPTDAEHAAARIDRADYRTLQKVGGRLPSVDGSGRSGALTLRTQLQDADPKAVLAAFAAVGALDTPDAPDQHPRTPPTDDDPDDVFQLTGREST